MRMTRVLPPLCAIVFAACTNQPQYVLCAPMGAAPGDVCRFTAEADAEGAFVGVGSLHVPVKPEALWKVADRRRRGELQTELDRTTGGAVSVPVFRLEHYSLSVEWTVHNLEDSPGKFRVDLNGANEEYAYDSLMLLPDDPDDPAPPPLAGNIPFDIGPGASVSGVFREDQLREAAIDLDQITRGNVNPFAAMLTISKNAPAFQPVTPYDPMTMTGGTPEGPEVPALAFRQLIRVDMALRPTRRMEMEFTIRLREHVDVVHEMGLNAPAGELDLRDPPYYALP
jgi:hypothetical protein